MLIINKRKNGLNAKYQFVAKQQSNDYSDINVTPSIVVNQHKDEKRYQDWCKLHAKVLDRIHEQITEEISAYTLNDYDICIDYDNLNISLSRFLFKGDSKR